MFANIAPAKGQSLFMHLAQGIIIGIVLTALSYGVGLAMGWIDAVSWLEAFAVFTSYVCTFLCVVERRINYPIGAVSTAAYCVLFFQFGLIASMAINAFLAVYLVYGWFRWRADSNTRPVTRMSLTQWILYALVAATGYLIVVFISSSLGGTLAWTDSLILALTILAQFMLDNKKIENWGVWAIMNCFAIYTYFSAGLALVGFQYIFFLANTAYGYVMWKKSKVADEVPAQPAMEVALA
jgi:nicotinamide mononucleotide transporter